MYFFFLIKKELAFVAEKAMATHSSTLTWKIPWTEDTSSPQSMGSLRDFTFTSHFHVLEKDMATHSSVLAWSDLAAAAFVEDLFMCILAICMSSLQKSLFRPFPHFWLGCLFFWYWLVWAGAFIFWKLTLCQLFHLPLFSPILKVVFSHCL